MRARTPLLLVLAIVVVAAGVAALVAILTGDLIEDDTNGQLLVCALVVAIAYLAASPGLVLLDQRRWRGLAVATIGLAVLAIVVGVIAVFADADDDYESTLTKLAATLFVVAVVAGAASAVAHRQRDGDPTLSAVLSAAAVAFAAVAGLLLCIAIWGESEDATLWRGFGSTLVLALVAGALSPVPRRARDARPAAEASARVDAEDAPYEAHRV